VIPIFLFTRFKRGNHKATVFPFSFFGCFYNKNKRPTKEQRMFHNEKMDGKVNGCVVGKYGVNRMFGQF
jgi:hypothetical protein